jgi:hypothetical protein
MSVASVHAAHEQPERGAWTKLQAWVEPKWCRTQELEKPQDTTSPEGDLMLDLYLPIEG